MYDKDATEKSEPFVRLLTGLTFANMEAAQKLGTKLPQELQEKNLRQLVFDVGFQLNVFKINSEFLSDSRTM